jgi:hypothetical protein
MTGTDPELASPDLPAAGGTTQLIGYGRVGWEHLTGMLAGAEAAWADYSGFHIGPVPATPPPYSHLWAWTDRWLARARIDRDAAIIGVLAVGGEPETALTVKLSEGVRYQLVQAKTWPGNEKRVGPLAPDLANRGVDAYLVAGARPVTFVAAAGRGPDG